MIDDIKKVRRKLGMNREEAKKKAEALVARMTLEEKASQLRYDAPAIKDWEFRRITGGMRTSRCCQSRAGNGFSTGDRNGGSF